MDSVIKINANKTLADKEVEELIRRTENKISYYTVRKDVFDPILREIEAVTEINVSLDSSSVDISFSAKKETYQKVYRILRNHGFEPGTKPPEDATGHTCFWRDEAGRQLWVQYVSKSCRRIQTGTKMVEQPVYETVCDDE